MLTGVHCIYRVSNAVHSGRHLGSQTCRLPIGYARAWLLMMRAISLQHMLWPRALSPISYLTSPGEMCASIAQVCQSK